MNEDTLLSEINQCRKIMILAQRMAFTGIAVPALPSKVRVPTSVLKRSMLQ